RVGAENPLDVANDSMSCGVIRTDYSKQPCQCASTQRPTTGRATVSEPLASPNPRHLVDARDSELRTLSHHLAPSAILIEEAAGLSLIGRGNHVLARGETRSSLVPTPLQCRRTFCALPDAALLVAPLDVVPAITVVVAGLEPGLTVLVDGGTQAPAVDL